MARFATGSWFAMARIAVEHARRRPLQSALLVLGIALGVAVVVAVDVANASAMTAFRLSTAATGGRATHRVVGGPTGLDEGVYTTVRVDLAIRASAPVVQGTVRAQRLGRAPMTLLGIDPFAEAPFRDFLGTGPGSAQSLAALLTRPGAVLLSRDVAAAAGLGPGDSLDAVAGRRVARLTVVGLLEPSDAISRRALESLLLADIATAQEVLGKTGVLDQIDLVLTEDEDARTALAKIAAILPADASVVPASERQESMEAMTSAFRMNLTALSLLALLVGLFLILNTMRFSVVQRRPTIATLRALGVTRLEIHAIILLEAALLGIVGATLGVALGAAMGRGAVAMVTRTINDLYFTVTVREVSVPGSLIARSALLGVIASLAAAAWPAIEATAVPPVSALRRSDVEAASHRAVPRLLAVGVALACVAGALLLLPGQRIDVGFAALAAIVLAFACAAPAATLGAMAVAAPITGRLWGTIGRLAPRDISRALSRTAVAVAALTVAVCVSIGVSVMVSSFRATVERWLEDGLRADVFVAARSDGNTAAATLDPAMIAEIAAMPSVAATSTALDVTARSPDLGEVPLFVISSDIAGDRRWFASAVGPPAAVRDAMARGAVMVSEQYARRRGLATGDELRLSTPGGVRSYPVAAVVREFSSDRGHVFMLASAYESAWKDDRVGSLALILRDGASAQAFADELRARFGGAEGVSIRSTRDLRRDALAVFDRTFAITGALQLLAIVVAFIGVLAALLAVQLERTREFATLRATGMTTRQLAGLSLLETGLLGLVAGLLSWPAGVVLSLVLIHVINRRSFGWSLVTSFDADPFARALLVAVGAALLAGVYPALRLRRLAIARALREE